MNTTSLITALTVGIALTIVTGCSLKPEALSPRKMQVLFLGHDSEEHNVTDYMPLLAAALAPHGFQFTYSSDPRNLNSTNLDNFDALMLLAEYDQISTSQEKDLLKFVKSGGAFLALNSAVSCFNNSIEFGKLLGARAESSDTASVTVEVVSPEHPIMQGYTPFETWDQIYSYKEHTRGKQVLMQHSLGDSNEPLTWIQDYGRGRVFYTGFGHDARTWEQAGFQDLLHRALLWTIGPAKKQAVESLELPLLEYSDGKIPNYEKRNPAPKLQAPLSPEESMKHIQVPPGFKLELFASEPDIINPISMNWDAQGRLWLLETVDYPNMIEREEGKGRDRIKILEDTDGDGKADKFTVFAEDLSVPTSLVFCDGGVIVAQAPQVLFLRDNDGDDVADERRVLMDGWGSYDTHATLSNLRYGLDNKIWGVVGYSGFDGVVDGKPLKFRQGIVRFEQDGSGLEYLSQTSNNTWGLGFSETFDVFISTANNTHSGYMGIPHDHLQDSEGLTFKGVQKIDGHYHFHPVTRNFRQVDVFGGFTAAAGHALYTARSFPSEYWNRIAFVCEPTGHLVHRAILEANGAGFQEKDGWNIMSSYDEWVSPVCAEVGPDGALWIADWYNFIIQHNPTPEGFENGEGNAHINPLRDKQHGRIYRISHEDSEDGAAMDLSRLSTNELVPHLKHSNQFWRLHAQRLLVEQDATDEIENLLNMLNDQSDDHLGLNHGALHALATLQGIGALEDPLLLESIYDALKHKTAGVRKAAIKMLPADGRTAVELMASNTLFDRDDHVRLAAINKVFDLPSNIDLAQALVELSNDTKVQNDVWLARATYLAAVKHRELFVQALLKAQPDALTFFANPENKNDIVFEDPDLDVSAWYDQPTPAWWGNHDIEVLDGFDGLAWYRKDFSLTTAQANRAAVLHLARVADEDITYVNGKKVGKTSGWDKYRVYRIPASFLKSGQNTIAVQVNDRGGGGGIWGEPDDLFLTTGADTLQLAGTWKLAIEKVVASAISPLMGQESIQSLFLKHYGPYAASRAEELKRSRALIDRSVTIRTVRDQMKYDLSRIEVKPGELIELVFVNDDAMQHNLLILSPGTLELVGESAEALAQTANGAELSYRPQMEEILEGSPLVNPGETHTILFKVPDEPGDFPFVCTFPGHYRTMNGMIVSKEGI